MGIKSSFLSNKGVAIAIAMLVGGSSGILLRANTGVEENLIVTQTVRTIKGMVTDQNGEPLIGCNVVVVGSQEGVITDLNGKFTLRVSDRAKQLKITYIGYVDQIVAIGNSPEIRITLKEDNNALEEVVVVGYGLKEDSNPDAVGVKTGDTEPTFKVVETMPKFPGGTRGLMQYLARSIKYPVIAQEKKQQGRVIIKMVVGKDGSLSEIKVLRSVSPSLDTEAMRVVSNMPKWEPGLQRGQAVAVEYTLPITFRLQ